MHYPDIYLFKPPREEQTNRKLKPILKVSGDRNKELLFQNLGILEDGMQGSISHEQEFAVATVVLECMREIEIFS